jgi:hypothetical protein
MYVVQL